MPYHKGVPISETEISCGECGAFAADRLDFQLAEAVCRQGRQLSGWWAEWRREMTADIMAAHGWKTLKGRSGRRLQLENQLRDWERRQHPYFRVPPHRRAHPPGHLLLYILCGRVLWLLDHLHAATQDQHLLRVGAPDWMVRLVRPVRGGLSVTTERWSIVRTAAARRALAACLGLKARTLQRKLQNRGRIREELAESRAQSQEGFAFLYAVASPAERQQLLEHSAYQRCAREGAEFSIRAPDGLTYFRARIT